jgi:serine-type D-Ala-D-Ala carboxypeptidase (penicillin-binding protein 5/6)
MKITIIDVQKKVLHGRKSKELKRAVVCIIAFILMFGNIRAFAVSLPKVVADGAMLVDANSGKILYEKNKDEKFYPASTTKLMTALLVLENCKLDDKVIIGKKPSSFVDGNKIYLFENEEFTVEQLLNALLIESANDVAIALAEHVSGSEEAFAELMNKRAKELGCTNTNFVNSHGLFDKNHYTTANDLLLITKEDMKNDTFRQIMTKKTYTVEPTNKQPKPRVLYSNNEILLNTKFHVDGADGGKVGYTSESGHSFVGSATRGDTHLIVVLLHDKKPGMWEDASGLLKYGFANYKTIKEVSEGDNITSLKIDDGNIEVPLIAENTFYYTCPLDENPKIESNISLWNTAKDIISKGEKMGTIDYSVNDIKIGTVNLIANKDITQNLVKNNKTDPHKAPNLWLIAPAVCFLPIGILTKIKRRRRKKQTE